MHTSLAFPRHLHSKEDDSQASPGLARKTHDLNQGDKRRKVPSDNESEKQSRVRHQQPGMTAAQTVSDTQNGGRQAEP